MAALPCISCGRELEPVFRDVDLSDDANQPHGGTAFTSRGHYGSTVFDPTLSSNEYLELSVCDDCMVEKAERIRYRQAVQRHDEVVVTRTFAEHLAWEAERNAETEAYWREHAPELFRNKDE